MELKDAIVSGMLPFQEYRIRRERKDHIGSSNRASPLEAEF
jgi:hypothetical protein